MHINLHCKVGRGASQCIGTFAVTDSQPEAVARNLADMAQARKTDELLRGGVAPERIVFSRETVGARPKKGK